MEGYTLGAYSLRLLFRNKCFIGPQSLLDCLVFFGRPTVVHGEFVQPRSYPILRYLDFLPYFRPVGFEQCGRVEFLPTIFGLDIHVTSRIPNDSCDIISKGNWQVN